MGVRVGIRIRIRVRVRVRARVRVSVSVRASAPNSNLRGGPAAQRLELGGELEGLRHEGEVAG